METQLVAEFVSRTGANHSDALSCLTSWGWDLKKALIDYNDTSTTEFFSDRAASSGVQSPIAFAAQSHHNNGDSRPSAIAFRHTASPAVSVQTSDLAPATKATSAASSLVLRKPSLTKTDSIDVVDYRKFHRGISRATDDNVHLVQHARSAIAMDFHTNGFKPSPASGQRNANGDSGPSSSAGDSLQLDSPDYTFTLPDISIYPDDFRRFLERDLIECSTLSSLEQAQRLNWWAEAGYCRKLWPLSTSGDGNCLLHAASLALWGFHDRKLTLRTALHAVLSRRKGAGPEALWRRWRFQQTRLNKQAGFVYSDAEWAREWDDIVALASPEPRQTNGGCASTKNASASRRRSMVMEHGTAGGRGAAPAPQESFDENATYESLEEIHILALAHVLRRTIVVVSDTVLRDMNGEAMAPIPFGGVYLPFEIPAADCHRAPLLLTYDMAHFSALVSMETGSDDAPAPASIPLIDIDNVLLPIQFCIDPGEDFVWSTYDGTEGNWALSDREHVALLREYLDVMHVAPLGSPEDELATDEFSDEDFEGALVQQPDAFGMAAGGPSGSDAPNGKSKAAKQLQSVAKQFGSIGKSMSKKIKKNIGSITKIGSGNGTTNGKTNASSAAAGKKAGLSSAASTQSFNRNRILCAQLKAKRYDYQEEMIRNYLECAQERFLDVERLKLANERKSTSSAAATTPPAAVRSSTGSDASNASNGSATQRHIDPSLLLPLEVPLATCCINAGCQNFGTSLTCYMCTECFEKQKERELNAPPMDSVARYGAGNSKFYAQSDHRSHAQIQRIPSVKRLNELDQTLYLSNSTFYNDQRQQQQQQLNDADQQYLQNGFRTASAYVTPAQRTSDEVDTASRLPTTASVFSPGRTIIHKIALPPADPATSAVHRTSYASAAPHVATAIGGIASGEPVPEARTCRTDGCLFYGSAATNFYCSKCCQMQRTSTALYQTQVGVDAAGSRTQSKVLTDV